SGGTIAAAREHGQRCSTWHSARHYHSGTGWHHALDGHYGHATTIREARADVLTTAYPRNPRQFVRKHPEPPDLPTAASINKPDETDTPQESSTDSANP